MTQIPSEGDGDKDASPGRYLLKFESFSLLSTNGINKKMIIYPDGDGCADGCDHISVYLAIAKTSSLQAGWEVNATFSFLIFDQIHGTYLVMRGMAQRFHNIKTEWGVSKCISHETFRDPSKGYLVNDNCIFGVDVSVIKNHGVGECVSLSETKSYKHKWQIFGFSKLKDKLYSEEFRVGGYKWKLLLYPASHPDEKGRSVSIFLVSVDAESFDRQRRVNATFSISVKDQISGAHLCSCDYSHWFSATEVDWGLIAFMLLHEFKNPKKGYLVEDCCIVEANVTVVGDVNGLT
ncbi:hypothetical protein K7X08_023810 [Anisodus acutangulus]|uniref:MATH domain-containing protein n=1 Tax=Anisodus acutangulus TaxID=402998 RepID=A0A9Q1L8B8_9SOLA|nr:hypothetical protein K7X08_023810 [Anisodus acutangulus]